MNKEGQHDAMGTILAKLAEKDAALADLKRHQRVSLETRISSQRYELRNVMARLAAAEKERDEAQKENTLLRAALAVSKDPCIYCKLPAEEQAKCQLGFPGCDRADDQMGCPELGAALERDAALAQEAKLREALEGLIRSGGLWLEGMCPLCGLRYQHAPQCVLAQDRAAQGGDNG